MATVKQCDVCKGLIKPGAEYTMFISENQDELERQYMGAGKCVLQADLCNSCKGKIMDHIGLLQAGIL